MHGGPVARQQQVSLVINVIPFMQALRDDPLQFLKIQAYWNPTYGDGRPGTPTPCFAGQMSTRLMHSGP